MAIIDNVKKIFGLNQDENKNLNTKIAENAQKIMNASKEPPRQLTYNPFLKKDGTLINKFWNYQSMLDNGRIAPKTKEYITQATGLTPSNTGQQSDATQIATSENYLPQNLNKSLSKMDMITEMPKLSVGNIKSIITNFFEKSPVITPKDAEGIYKAQQESGVSALAILGIGALESGYGTSNIAKKKNNIWGYGAVNSNPVDGAKNYDQMSEGASQFANQFKDTYYNKYGAHSIYAVGSGDNPSGKGYAYYNNGDIDSSWVNKVNSIMQKFYNSISMHTQPDSTSANDIVDEAKKYLGTPYVWGGSSPSGFDCSGLMQYIFNQKGITLNRTASEQFKNGTPINIEQLQPGDLVFFEGYKKSKTEPGHVGLYVGNGQYLHAPSSGDVVKISNLSGRGDYAGARRVLQ